MFVSFVIVRICLVLDYGLNLILFWPYNIREVIGGVQSPGLQCFKSKYSEMTSSSSMSFFTTGFYLFSLYILAWPMLLVAVMRSNASNLGHALNEVALLSPVPSAMSVFE